MLVPDPITPKHSLSLLSYVVMFLAATTAALAYAQVDGYIRPVTTQMVITLDDIEYDGEWSTINGEFVKLRDCDIESVTWFFGRPGDRPAIPVPVATGTDVNNDVNPGPPVALDVGSNITQTLRVRLAPEVIVSNSYAYVTHRCYGNLLPTTRTRIYNAHNTGGDN